ncbi:MAG: hypothetical protein LUI87_17195 [Lachnospiraceae bacterium]|nr:hypothetical protein [Lachnospiraceae bacterium]
MSIKREEQVFSSSIDTDLAKEYVYHNFKYLPLENSPVYGVKDASEVVITPLYFDELCYLLSAEGTHVVLFGGTWSLKTQGVIDRINYFARKYGVDTVYLYDFRADGSTEDTNFKVDITAQDSYDGPGKEKSIGCANCNYIYGELVTRHLTNLNDWVAGKVGSGDDITYLNLYQDAVTVPNVHEPFLFVFNKDNRVDNSGLAQGREDEYFPIVSALELDGFRGKDGQIYSDEACSVLDAGFDERLETVIFGKIGDGGISPYTHADYMYDAFKRNERGHAFKTEDCFQKGEQINIQPVTLAELLWILDQKGSFLVVIAGAWCANSQGGITTINDYAVANHTRVYMFDTRLDGKHPIDFWKYPRLNELKLSHPALEKYSFELWEKRLPGAPMLLRARANTSFGKRRPLTIEYTDESGVKHVVLPVDLPYLFACNQDAISERDQSRAPVLAACNHGGIELINCLKSFVYYKPNYRLYTAGVYAVFSAYCDNLGIPVNDISIDRSAPIVPGKPVRHIETVAYHKEHDWYKERGGLK